MSGHLIGCVKEITGLGKSHKLALVAFADSADDRTHIAFPGYEGVQAWADCSRSRAAELIADLVEAGYLRQHKTARPGRRAEYVVFPAGCCDLHRTPATDETVAPEAIAGWVREATGVELEPWQLDALAGLYAGRNGSEISDPSSVNGSETSDPSAAEPAQVYADPDNGSEISDPLGPASRTRTDVRVQNGSETPDPFTTSTTTPLTPASGGAICAKHPNGDGTNCRGCGTTNRQIAERTRREKAAQARAAEQARIRHEREQIAAAARTSDDPDVAQLLTQARQSMRGRRPA